MYRFIGNFVITFSKFLSSVSNKLFRVVCTKFQSKIFGSLSEKHCFRKLKEEDSRVEELNLNIPAGSDIIRLFFFDIYVTHKVILLRKDIFSTRRSRILLFHC